MCGGLTMAGRQVPTKAVLSDWRGEENIMKLSWDKIRTGRDHSPITVTSKTDLTWGKIDFIYY